MRWWRAARTILLRAWLDGTNRQAGSRNDTLGRAIKADTEGLETLDWYHSTWKENLPIHHRTREAS